MEIAAFFVFFRKLTLTRLETRLGFVDHVYAAFTANDAAITVAPFEGAE